VVDFVSPVALAVAYLRQCHEQGLTRGAELRALVERAFGEGEAAQGARQTFEHFLERPTKPARMRAAALALRPYLAAEPERAQRIVQLVASDRDAAMEVTRVASELQRTI